MGNAEIGREYSYITCGRKITYGSLLYNIFITSIYIYNYVCHKLPYIVALPKLYALLPVPV